MTFNEKIKREIIDWEYTKNDFMVIMAFYCYNNYSLLEDPETKQQFWEIKNYSQHQLQFFQKYLQKYFELPTKLVVPDQPTKIYRLQIPDFHTIPFLEDLETSCRIFSQNKMNHQAILTGIFLAHGVVLDIEKNVYHAEIGVSDWFIQQLISKILKKLKIQSKVFNYKNKTKIYVKRAESLSDLLKSVNAVNQMLELEDHKILKDYLNQQQRLNNLDVANLSKVTKAATEQVAAIKTIIDQRNIYKWNDEEQIIMEERLKNPYLSLHELAVFIHDKYSIAVTKSGVNYLLRKTKKWAKQNQPN
ncbi:DNA-binding protein WhiA [Mycoplasmoides fastidiosum]|uniref:DNA-binding protein WhiA n=1 Tax=Mycoplasmoides fastidiosum TaxID=92758 RepID=A0ABU0LXX3_9BACT|nr:DNA-binding protein WhiA [Mycoplasmoides fastidiosum]MDQ0513567.1 DNA-binding protein WhiA [Mycoplasmoides fastidiosum]UUD38010.1 DNA-binding protein WhiA [Mycoplasmoides fastidiosum]